MSSISTPEVNYEAWNQALRTARRRGKILVIYPAGSLSHAELFKKDKLREFYFLCDNKDPVMYIAGMELSGLIMEPGATIDRDRMAYVFSRIRGDRKDLLFILDEKQWLVLMVYLQRVREDSDTDDKQVIDRFMKDVEDALDRGEYLKRCWEYEKS